MPTDYWQSLVLRYGCILEELLSINHELLTALSQYTSVEEYEKRLSSIEERGVT